jgi:hypothetical protein
MLNDRQTRPFLKSSGDCPSGLFRTTFATGQFCTLATFSWDSPALTFRKKIITDRQSFNNADNCSVYNIESGAEITLKTGDTEKPNE